MLDPSLTAEFETIIALQEELRHVLRPRNIYEGSGQGGSDELISLFEVAEKCWDLLLVVRGQGTFHAFPWMQRNGRLVFLASNNFVELIFFFLIKRIRRNLYYTKNSRFNETLNHRCGKNCIQKMKRWRNFWFQRDFLDGYINL